MTTITMRPFAGEADLQAICDLLNVCDAVDKLDDNYAVNDLRQEFTNPQLDPARDLQLWEDANGQLIGFGQTWTPHPDIEEDDSYLYFRIHPQARGSGLEDEIIEWGEQRLREVAQELGRSFPVRSGTRDHHTYGLQLLQRHGFTPVRYYFTMTRPLDQPIPIPQLPEGFTVSYVTDERVGQWVELYNQSFIDHWNHRPMAVEERQHTRSDPKYLPERDLVIIAPNGTLAALCFCAIDPEDNQRNSRNEGWIDKLGTRRGFRKIGLGKAILLIGLHRLKSDGVETAKLGVDAENPTGALKLYESVGFRRSSTWILHSKQL